MTQKTQRKLSPPSIAILDTNVFAIPGMFSARRTNRLLRRRYHLMTTRGVVMECNRLGFPVPCFVEVVDEVRRPDAFEFGNLQAQGLSTVDIELRALGSELRSMGEHCVLVTFDGMLRRCTEEAMEPPDWAAFAHPGPMVCWLRRH